jgi:hypothetical protein
VILGQDEERAEAGLRQRLDAFLFEPRSPQDLGATRIVYFSGALLYYFGSGIPKLTPFPKGLLFPVSFFRWFLRTLPSEHIVDAMWIIFGVALVLATIGLASRSAMVVAAVSGIFLVGLRNNFGKLIHFNSLLAITLFVFALSYSGDALSVDALLRRRKGAPPIQDSGEYTWPLRVGGGLLTLAMFIAGVAKIEHSGLSLVTGRTLATMLIAMQTQSLCYEGGVDTAAGLALWVAESPVLCATLGAMTVAFELGAPLAMLGLARRSRWGALMSAAIIAGLFMMQLGIRLTFGYKSFTPFMLSYAFFVPWAGMGAWLRARGRR